MVFIYLWVLNLIIWIAPFGGKAKGMVFEVIKQAIAYSLHIPIMALIVVLFQKTIQAILSSNYGGLSTNISDLVFVVLVSYSMFKILDQVGEIANAIITATTSSKGADLTATALIGAMTSQGMRDKGSALLSKGGNMAKDFSKSQFSKIGGAIASGVSKLGRGNSK
jgi:hypothetical protein